MLSFAARHLIYSLCLQIWIALPNIGQGALAVAVAVAVAVLQPFAIA
jgi:hypothetical protein